MEVISYPPPLLPSCLTELDLDLPEEDTEQLNEALALCMPKLWRIGVWNRFLF